MISTDTEGEHIIFLCFLSFKPPSFLLGFSYIVEWYYLLTPLNSIVSSPTALLQQFSKEEHQFFWMAWADPHFEWTSTFQSSKFPFIWNLLLLRLEEIFCSSGSSSRRTTIITMERSVTVSINLLKQLGVEDGKDESRAVRKRALIVDPYKQVNILI